MPKPAKGVGTDSSGRWVGAGGLDETFIKVRGQWMYLYRAVDGQGNTVEFFLSRTRGIAATPAFFRKALKHHREPHSITLDGQQPSHSALRCMGMNGEFNFRGPESGDDSLLSIPEHRCGAGSSPGEGALAPDVGIQDVLQCAPRDYRHRTGPEDPQTPVRNSDPMAVESRCDLASRHGRIGRIAGAHSGSCRSDNPICTRTPQRPFLRPPIRGVVSTRARRNEAGLSSAGITIDFDFDGVTAKGIISSIQAPLPVRTDPKEYKNR